MPAQQTSPEGVSWRHRTNKGRVVYERRPHLFSFRDSYRIVKSLVREASEKDVLYVLLTISSCLETLADYYYKRALDNLSDYLMLPEEKRLMLKIIGAFVDFIRERGGDFLRALVEKLADFLSKEDVDGPKNE